MLCLLKVCISSAVLYSAYENIFDLASLDRFPNLQAKHGEKTYIMSKTLVSVLA